MIIENIRPKVKIPKEHGLFDILDTCVLALRRDGKRGDSIEMQIKVFYSKGFENSLNIMKEYCEITFL